MYVENLINRKLMHVRTKKLYKIRHLPKKYGDDAINAGHYYIPILNLKNNDQNVLHLNKRTYKQYIILDELTNCKDEEATKMLHDLTCTLN